jgi:hypothetical protein
VKLDRRNKILLGVLGVLFLLGVPGRLAWSMRSSAVSDAKAVREETAIKQIELARARKAKANEQQLTAALGELVLAMPATPDQQSLLDTLAGLAKETNVSWEVLSSAVPQSAKAAARDATGDSSTTAASAPATSADTGDTAAASSGSSAANSSFAFDATVSGDEASISAFLERVRSIDRLVVIDKLQLNWDKTTGSTNGGVNARLSMRAFMWKGAATATTSTSTTVAGTTSTTPTTVAP